MKQCPKCEVDLKAKNIGPVEVDECQSCKGIWFDKDELRQAKDSTDSDLNWMDFEIWKHEDQFKSVTCPRKCPTCCEPMVTLKYGSSEVVIDYCKTCKGTWLDRDEFKRIINALKAELLIKSFPSYVEESIRKGIEILTGPESFISEWNDFSTVLRLMQYRLFIVNPTLLNAVTAVQKSIR
jgi:Zn-finger nucleic acid-binding protein